jgi:hypothetical protein
MPPAGGNGRYCYPLTITDHASHFLLLCEQPAKPPPSNGCSANVARRLLFDPTTARPVSND